MTSVGFGFTEQMAGTFRAKSAALPAKGRIRFDLEVEFARPGVLTSLGVARGTVDVEGLAQGARAVGTVELSPLWKRRIRYRFAFDGTDGKHYRFDGAKRIRHVRPLRSWTTLPGRVRDETGDVVAEALLRFDLRRQLLPLLASFRRAR